MDQLWAPWRMDYIRLEKEDTGCIFCNNSNSPEIEDLVVHKGEYSFVIMNLYPYNNGHVMVAPYEHCGEFESLEENTQLEMMRLTSRTMEIIRKNMKAEGFNFGANFGDVAGAGIKDHLHFHIVPRWKGDTNFMPVTSYTKVQVDALKETCELLANEFRKY